MWRLAGWLVFAEVSQLEQCMVNLVTYAPMQLAHDALRQHLKQYYQEDQDTLLILAKTLDPAH